MILIKGLGVIGWEGVGKINKSDREKSERGWGFRKGDFE